MKYYLIIKSIILCVAGLCLIVKPNLFMPYVEYNYFGSWVVVAGGLILVGMSIYIESKFLKKRV